MLHSGLRDLRSLLFVRCLATGLLINAVETDADGTVVNKFFYQFVGIAAAAIPWLLVYWACFNFVLAARALRCAGYDRAPCGL